MHFGVKDVLLTWFCSGDQLVVEQVLACICKLKLNLLALAVDECLLTLAADEHLLTLGHTAIGGLLLLNAFDGVPAGAQCACDMLVCDEQVLFLQVWAHV